MKYFSQIIRGVARNFWPNVKTVFSGKNLLWQLLAIILTVILVTSGFDWRYFELFSHGWIFYVLVPAAAVGFLVPVFLPIALLFAAVKNPKLLKITYPIIQAEVMAWLVSAVYKAFTGRVHPIPGSIIDTSRQFRFGFLRGGVFWGWPSSHSIVAFALAFVLMTLFPSAKRLKIWLWIYALYIGFGVSVSVHWFSDFVAGAIIGAVIGIVVGKSFKAKENHV